MSTQVEWRLTARAGACLLTTRSPCNSSSEGARSKKGALVAAFRSCARAKMQWRISHSQCIATSVRTAQSPGVHSRKKDDVTPAFLGTGLMLSLVRSVDDSRLVCSTTFCQQRCHRAAQGTQRRQQRAQLDVTHLPLAKKTGAELGAENPWRGKIQGLIKIVTTSVHSLDRLHVSRVHFVI